MRVGALGKAVAVLAVLTLVVGCAPGHDGGLEARMDNLVESRGAGGTFSWAEVEPGDWTKAVVVVPCAATAKEIREAIGVDWDGASTVSGGSECVSSDRWVYLVVFETGTHVTSWGLVNRVADGTDLIFPDNMAVGPNQKLQLRRISGEDAWDISVAESSFVGRGAPTSAWHRGNFRPL